MWKERIIGQYTEGRPGPLFLVSAAIHGNETAGVKAIEKLAYLLKMEAINNTAFRFSGKFLGFIGNLKAYKQGRRYIDLDLNRIWNHEGLNDSIAEHIEMKAIKDLIKETIAEEEHITEIYLLDLHTTSSPRGIFTVPCDQERSLDLAMHLHCPVITNVTDQLKGSMVAYFSDLKKENGTITCLAFEAGQHDQPLSVTMSIAAMVNCMRTIGCVDAEEVEGKHDDVLEAFAEGLPGKCKIVYTYALEDAGLFEMLPGFEGFQRVMEGQLLAHYDGHEVRAPMEGRLLMPLYQKQGKEGFFIVREEQ